MFHKIIFYSCLLLLISACTQSEVASNQSKNFKIAFGSCGHENHPLPIFNNIVEHDPDLFIFLGDNIYGDTKVMDTLRAKYNRLGAKSSYQNLKKNIPILATWDDHDFGWNDAGRHYPHKKAAKEIFMDFFEEPADSKRSTREGIYDAYSYEHEDLKIQIILLDTRTFRDNLHHPEKGSKQESRYFYNLDYTPHTTSDSTLLGEVQWQWLDDELQKEAAIRIIGSSTQFGIEYNGYEAWANFPHEQKRFLNLIKKNKADGIIFISGDVHYAEISKINEPDLYPIYDITSSGLSSTWHFATPNKNRIEGPIMENHFGLITVETNKKKATTIQMEIWDIRDNQRIEYSIPLASIHFDK